MSKKVELIDKDLGWKKIKKQFSRADLELSVGILEGSPSRTEGGPTNAVIGHIHEYGLGNNPERSFLRSTMDDKKGSADRMVIRDIRRGMTPEQVLNLLGLKLQADVRATIRSNIPPALSASTIAQKGSSVALVDTGQLVQSIDYQVKKKGI